MKEDTKELVMWWSLVILWLLGVYINYHFNGIGGGLFALIIPPYGVLVGVVFVGAVAFMLLCGLLGLY